MWLAGRRPPLRRESLGGWQYLACGSASRRPPTANRGRRDQAGAGALPRITGQVAAALERLRCLPAVAGAAVAVTRRASAPNPRLQRRAQRGAGVLGRVTWG